MFRPSEDFTIHPFLRWLPAVAWVIVFALYAGMAVHLAGTTSRRVDASWLSWLFVAALVAVALYSVVITARAWKDARSRSPYSALQGALDQPLDMAQADPLMPQVPPAQPGQVAQRAHAQLVALTQYERAVATGSGPAKPGQAAQSTARGDSGGAGQGTWPATAPLTRLAESLRASTAGSHSEDGAPGSADKAGFSQGGSEAAADAALEAKPGAESAGESGSEAEPYAAELAGAAGAAGAAERADATKATAAAGAVRRPLKQRLSDMLDALENAGILDSGEVPLDVALAATADYDELEDFGLDELLATLRTVEAERGIRYRHLALYPTQGEVTDRQIAELVEDVTHLVGRFGDLGSIQLESAEGEKARKSPPDDTEPENAVVHFDLDGHWYSVPFRMFPQGFPLDLIEGLAGTLAPETKGRVFVEAWSDGLVAISCIARGRLAELDAALAWDGETFGMVDALAAAAPRSEPASVELEQRAG